MGESFEVLVGGCFPPERLVVRWIEEPRATTAALEASIEAAWRAAQRRARRRGVMLYAGQLCRLIEYCVEDGRLRLTLGPTDFRALVGTNWAQPHHYTELGPAVFANAVGVSAAVRTADGRLLVVKRGRGVAHHVGWYHVPSGHLEPEAHGADPFRAILAELREELGLAEQEVARLVCLGLARAVDTYKPELVFQAETALSAEAVIARFRVGEHQAVLALPDHPVALRRFLRHYRRITPAARACLSLHGISPWATLER